MVQFDHVLINVFYTALKKVFRMKLSFYWAHYMQWLEKFFLRPHPEACQTSKMELYAKIVIGFSR